MAIKASLLLCFLFVASLSVSLSSAYIRSGGDRGSRQNPFHFRNKWFQTRYRNEQGYLRTLPRFDSNNGNLRGIANYRLIEFQARPQTFLLPHHADAEFLVYIVSGRALITVVSGNNRESYNLERDDVLRIPAGATAYAANRDNNQNLRIVKLVIPVGNPGHFQDFFPGGQQHPPSYFNGFSRRTLEAAFNSPYPEILRALLGEQSEQQEGQSQGQTQALVRASREQISQLGQNARSSQEVGQTRSGPFNLRNFQNPISNNYGRFWEAHPNQVPQLQDLDVSVTLTVLNQGSLFLPHKNSKTWVVAYISQGNGQFEIAAPRRLQEQEEQEGQEQEQTYGEIQRLSAELNQGDALVVPPGYPFALTASNNNKLHIVGFDINIQDNQRSFLAGERDNVIAQLDSAAKDLTFSGSAEQVERLLRNQRQSYFASAQLQPQPQEQEQEQEQEQPQEQQQEGRGNAFA